MAARGLRCFNPGNIKRTGIAWDGLMAPEDMTPEQAAETTFCVFRAPWWGIRAMAKILLNYRRKHNLRTVDQIMHRWAPGADNNPTTAYVTYVTRHLGVRRAEEINVEDFETLFPLVQAITWFENGLTILTDPYTWEYQAGLILAGVEPSTEYLQT